MSETNKLRYKYRILIPGMKDFKPWLVEEQLREINEQ